MKKEVVTFGCRLNTYESEIIKDAIKEMPGDVIVFNTCAVTKEAERQARQAIRKYKRNNPDAKIVVTGCGVQAHPDQFMKMPEVDQLIGNNEKFKAESYNSADKIIISDIMEVKELTPHLVSSFEGMARAFVQIQNGCNHRCTYCTIPFGRGNSRSVPLGEIKKQIELLTDNGYREFVFTGVDITDYGLDLPGEPTLGQTIKRLLDLVPALKRLRLSSLDPSEICADLWDLIENDERLLPHFHLSLQAGDDMVLKRMKRRHLRHHIFEFIARLRASRPYATIGADIIAGFPTETDEMFLNTKEIVGLLDFVHIFPFSPHDNTPASKMPQVPKPIIKERAAILNQVRAENYQKLLESWVGKIDTILVEKIDADMIIAKNDHFIPVRMKALPEHKVGDILNVSITGCNDRTLLA